MHEVRAADFAGFTASVRVHRKDGPLPQAATIEEQVAILDGRTRDLHDRLNLLDDQLHAETGADK